MGSLWHRSGTIERYADDLRASGAKAYFFTGGTTSPMSVYQDAGESAAHTHPVVADADGRWPDIFVPYTLSYDVRVTTADDVQLTFTQEIPNPDPVDLSVSAPSEQLVVTGMIHAELINGTKTSYVRLNGRTMGNAASGGTERANADTSALFTYLWNNLDNTAAPVSGGRGGSAAADFAANKTITLPDFRGALPIGLDDMGAAAGSFFSGLTFTSGTAITAGSRTGSNGVTLASGNLPAHSHSGTTAAENLHTHTGTTGTESQSHTHSGTSSSDGLHGHTFSGGAAASDGVHTHFTVSGGTSDTTPNSTRYTASSASQGGGSLGYQLGSLVAEATVSPTSDDGAHTHTVTGSIDSQGAHTHTLTTGNASVTHTHSFTSAAGSAHSHTFTTDTVGSSVPFNNIPRAILVTWYIKL